DLFFNKNYEQQPMGWFTMKVRGFTLIELLVVIAIIGILAAILKQTTTSKSASWTGSWRVVPGARIGFCAVNGVTRAVNAGGLNNVGRLVVTAVLAAIFAGCGGGGPELDVSDEEAQALLFQTAQDPNAIDTFYLVVQ